ncbi:unnamed protein product, partial [Brassica rapa subsp. narinosa]
LNFGSGEWPARERACRRRNSFEILVRCAFALLPRHLHPPLCLSSDSGPQRRICLGIKTRSALRFSEDKGFLSLASPVLVCFSYGPRLDLSDELSIGSMRLSEVKTKRSCEWPFGVSEFEVGGGETPVTFRDGGGQVEAEETRGMLMGAYPSTRPASLMRGPTEVG